MGSKFGVASVILLITAPHPAPALAGLEGPSQSRCAVPYREINCLGLVALMQTRNPFFDEVTKVMEGAVGLAQSAGEEARSAFRAQGDRLVAEFDLVRRDELDALRDALVFEIAELRAEIARLKTSPDTARPAQDAG